MIKKKAYAKLNLNLHVLPRKNSSGYHPVHTINMQLALYDELLFEPVRHGIEVICEHQEMPEQRDNLIYKAALLLQEMDPKKQGVKIIIRKNIPIRAGLGGGSSDAAAAILALSALWNIDLPEKQRFYLAENLGKDVHYSLYGKPAEIGGDGDKVFPLTVNSRKYWLVVIVPEETKPSTGWMYAHVDSDLAGRHIHFLEKIKEAMKMQAGDDFLKYLFNDFESVVFKYFPAASAMKQDLENNGALAVLLAGSGLSMVGFFGSETKAGQARELLSNKYKNVIISQLN